MATLLDTTMETLDTEDVHDNNNQCHASPQTDTPEDEEDEDFQFNAPSYYDLKNPSLERRYVNNADGYFSSPVPSNTTSRASPFEAAEASPSPEENRNNHALEENGDEQMEDTDKNMLDTTMVDEELSRSLLEDRPETFEEPTQSYLRRLQAEQYMREQTFMEDVPVEEKPHRVTKPRGPKLHSRTRPTNPNDPSRMSSTSRELLKIQEERLHLQLEKLKIREFHEKTKAQRPPTNRAASVSAELERHRKEREERLKARQAGQSALQKTAPKSVPKSVPAARRGPVIPETPPLKSIQLHRQYQETFRRKVEAEEQKQEKQRQFRANPMRVTSTPAKFEGSSKPLTEVIPFQLPGERYHEKAQERLEKKRLEEAEQLKSAGTFRAKPMPVYESENHEGRGFHVKSNEKPPTHVVPPTLATDRRASERAAFNAAEKERRQQEEAFRKQRESQQRQLKEEEIKHLRQEKMIFHARPVPEDKPPFQPKFDTKPLTEPISPISRS
ncbi:hypothetical protein BBP00_00008348 [Phytophthora kernoviae]|uniref:TPX2 C-terminal domain-containing protein n=1 Tax=Phytophthora kernoviae TaxID=325452 RepID=A0A3F2RFU2_9STRA|nr:hypothetical protein BBP00_00008348 [Phytophthora kernoviae]